MVPRFTDATIAVAVRGLRGVIAAAAACAAAAIGCDDMEGSRHAGYAYAGKRIDVRHDCSNPPLVRSDDLEAKRSSRSAQPIF